LSSTNTTFRALAKLMLLGALAFAPTTSRAQDPISSLTRFVNYRNPLYNYQSRPALDPAYNLPARTNSNYIISRENPLTVGGVPPVLRSNQPVMINPLQPIVGPYTIAPTDNTQECHFTFDIAKMNLPSGTYILKVKSQGEVYTEKFVNNK
jgi:hypothetical protein